MLTAKGFKLIFGGLGLAIAAVAAAIVTAQKRKAGQRRLMEFDSGQRCISCDGLDVELAGDAVMCNTCGHVASIASLRRASPSEKDLEAMYKPDDWHTPDP